MTTTSIPVAAFRYSADGRQALTETAKVRSAVEGLNSTSLARVDSSFQSLGATIARFTPLLSVAGLATFALSAVRAADAMGDAAERADISVESFTRLQYIAQQSDIEFNELTSSLRIFQDRLGDASRGGGPLVDTLERLNLSAGELAALPIEEQLALISERFRTMVPAVERASFANDFFGKSGTLLIPLLNKGGEELKELADQADRLGITMSTTAVQGIDAATKALARFSSAAKSAISETFGRAVFEIFGTGDELRDTQTRIEMLTKRRDELLANPMLFGPGGAAELSTINIQLDAMREKLEGIQKAAGTGFQYGEGAFPMKDWLAQLKDDLLVYEVHPTATRMFEEDEILKQIREDRLKRDEEFNDALIAQQSEVRSATISAQSDIGNEIDKRVRTELDERLDATRRAREYEVDQEKQTQNELLAIRSAGASAAQSLLTAYGGKYAGFAKGILIIEKAMAVKSIFMDTQKAMMKAIGQYGAPWGYALAAGIAVYGAARVAAIASNVVGGDNGPALGSPHNPVATTPASPDEPGSTQDTGGGRVVQLVVNGNVYSGRETVDFFVQQLQDRINEYDTVIINPKSRQATELLEARQ